ncbi:hypothetical protein BH09PSE1_BH09PSE1_07310 [soil metagenome]
MAAPSLLICGKIREPEPFAEEAGRYLQWLRDGRINRLVFCGWISDLDDHRPLISEIAAGGAEVRLIFEPQIRSVGNFLHQSKTLHYGLAAFEDEETVIKGRTDKMPRDWSIDLPVQRLQARRPAGADSPFRERVCIRGAMMLQPFFFNDMAFAGRAGDLKRLAHHDLWFDRDHCLLNAEQMFHSAPFMATSPVSQVFFRANPGLVHESADLSRALYDRLLNSRLFVGALAESLIALEQSYQLGFLGEDFASPSPVDDFEHVWSTENPDAGVEYSHAAHMLTFRSDALPAWLLDLPFHRLGGGRLRDLAIGMDSAVLEQDRLDLVAMLHQAFPDLPNIPPLPWADGNIKVFWPRFSYLG